MSVLEKVTDKSMALHIALVTSLLSVANVANAASGTKLVDGNGNGTYTGGTLGGNNVKGSFLNGKGGGVEGLETSMSNLTKVVVAVSALVGFSIAAFGIYILYKASKPNSQSNAMNGFIALIAGSALAILPYIVFSGGNTISGFGNEAKS